MSSGNPPSTSTGKHGIDEEENKNLDDGENSAEKQVGGNDKKQKMCSVDDASTAATGKDNSYEESIKRPKTNITTASQPIPGTSIFTAAAAASSPPQFISIQELISMSRQMTNMALAHEITVDNDFKLTRNQPPEGSIHERVEKCMNEAFWELLRKTLNEDPPDYSFALKQLTTMKLDLFSLLLPHHIRLRENIDSSLDLDLIQQQVDHGALDVRHYVDYIVSTMAKLCAPARDNQIQELREETDLVNIFKGIVELLRVMKLDMANFTLQQLRPQIRENSAEYERNCFQKYIDLHGHNSLLGTKSWLERNHQKLLSEEGAGAVVSVKWVLDSCYMELLEWPSDWPYPETISMDVGRFQQLRHLNDLCIIISAILLVTYNTLMTSSSMNQATAAPFPSNIMQVLSGDGSAQVGKPAATLKETLKRDLKVLLQDILPVNDTQDMSNISNQVISDINRALVNINYATLSDNVTKLLRAQINDVIKHDNAINKLMRRRVQEFVGLMADFHPFALPPQSAGSAAGQQVPPGLSSVQAELTQLTAAFIRLTHYNRVVYRPHYDNLLQEVIVTHEQQGEQRYEQQGEQGHEQQGEQRHEQHGEQPHEQHGEQPHEQQGEKGSKSS